jgi:arylsulfatase A
LAGAKLPTNKVIDGHSFLPQLMGKKGTSREWIFIELGNKWYVRDSKWKLNREGELFDMSNAPFEEKLVLNYAKNKDASEAYSRLQTALKTLSPEKGILDNADGSGRHGSNVNKKKNKSEE